LLRLDSSPTRRSADLGDSIRWHFCEVSRETLGVATRVNDRFDRARFNPRSKSRSEASTRRVHDKHVRVQLLFSRYSKIGRIRCKDRKSTRLNSSHVKI